MLLNVLSGGSQMALGLFMGVRNAELMSSLMMLCTLAWRRPRIWSFYEDSWSSAPRPILYLTCLSIKIFWVFVTSAPFSWKSLSWFASSPSMHWPDLRVYSEWEGWAASLDRAAFWKATLGSCSFAGVKITYLDYCWSTRVLWLSSYWPSPPTIYLFMGWVCLCCHLPWALKFEKKWLERTSPDLSCEPSSSWDNGSTRLRAGPSCLLPSTKPLTSFRLTTPFYCIDGLSYWSSEASPQSEPLSTWWMGVMIRAGGDFSRFSLFYGGDF